MAGIDILKKMFSLWDQLTKCSLIGGTKRTSVRAVCQYFDMKRPVLWPYNDRRALKLYCMLKYEAFEIILAAFYFEKRVV